MNENPNVIDLDGIIEVFERDNEEQREAFSRLFGIAETDDSHDDGRDT